MPLQFPDGFYWGCATSSHQVEGSNRNNQWWAWEQEGGNIRDGTTSGLACDHYNRFEEDFAARLPLDTFGFNRLCVYRGTPLWQEYLARGLVEETTDWYKYFKCSEIDPTCLPGSVINAERTAGLRRLFRYKLTHYPLQTLRLLSRFLRHMPLRDVVHLIIKPFLGKKQGLTKNEVLSRAVEHRTLKENAASLTSVPDSLLERAIEVEVPREKRVARLF